VVASRQTAEEPPSAPAADSTCHTPLGTQVGLAGLGTALEVASRQTAEEPPSAPAADSACHTPLGTQVGLSIISVVALQTAGESRPVTTARMLFHQASRRARRPRCLGAGDLQSGVRIIIGMTARRKANSQKSATTYPQRTTAFAEYRRRTGEWPVLSIALYVGRMLLMLAGISFLFWYGRSHSDAFTRTTLYFVLATLPVALGWSVGESLAWNHDLRRKGLLSGQAIMGVRQMPPE
jgi:hypothetical protein